MKKIVSFALILAAFSFIISCASAPPAKPAEPAPAAPAPQQPAAVPDPSAERAQALALQKRVDSLGLGSYDQASYDQANKDLNAGQDSYQKDNAASRTSFQSAIDGYNSVIAKGGPVFLSDRQKSADASRKAADDLKASVAVKTDYDKADAVYQRAVKEKDALDIEAANKDFLDAQAQFDAVAAAAGQKRDAATQALKAAGQDQATSEQKATDAEKALKDEGFAPSGS